MDYTNEKRPLTIDGVDHEWEVIIANDAMDPEEVARNAQSLVEQGARFVVVPLIMVDIAGPIFEVASIPYHAQMEGSQASGPAIPYKLIYPPVDYYTAESLVIVRRNHPAIETVAILGSSDPHSRSALRNDVSRSLKAFRLTSASPTICWKP